MAAMTIYKSPYPDVPVVEQNVFELLLNLDPSKPGLVGGFPADSATFIDAQTGTTLTRASLRSYATTLAYALRTHPFFPQDQPLNRGDTIMIFSPNTLTWPVLLYAATCAGLRITLANASYTVEELEYQLSDSGSKVLFVHPSLVSVARQAIGERDLPLVRIDCEWLTGVPDQGEKEGLSVHDLLQESNGQTWAPERFAGPDFDETVLMCYSSGTTGKPKGVQTTHKNIVTELCILKSGYIQFDGQSDALIGFLPFYHVYGAVLLLHQPVMVNVPVVIMTKFDPNSFCATIAKYRITVAPIVPPVLVVLARHPSVEQHDLSSLRILFCGAAPLGGQLVHVVCERLRSLNTYVEVMQGYGLTETSPVTHILPLKDAVRKIGSVGVLLPNTEARLVDEAGQDAPEGEPGEVWIRGGIVMKGYLNRPEATADTITADGWLKSGDVAVRDDEGFFTIVDRKKELIKYKGFQVPPAELEAILLTHPHVADAAVIGVYSASQATELPRAYLVPAASAASSGPMDRALLGAEVAEWLKKHVAPHKYLRGGVVLVDMIPKSPSGKILRRELRERARMELAVAEVQTPRVVEIAEVTGPQDVDVKTEMVLHEHPPIAETHVSVPPSASQLPASSSSSRAMKQFTSASTAPVQKPVRRSWFTWIWSKFQINFKGSVSLLWPLWLLCHHALRWYKNKP